MQPNPAPPNRLMTRTEVEHLTGISCSSIYRSMRAGDFPEPLHVSSRSVRWRADEIHTWITTRPRGGGMHPDAA